MKQLFLRQMDEISHNYHFCTQIFQQISEGHITGNNHTIEDLIYRR